MKLRHLILFLCLLPFASITQAQAGWSCTWNFVSSASGWTVNTLGVYVPGDGFNHTDGTLSGGSTSYRAVYIERVLGVITTISKIEVVYNLSQGNSVYWRIFVPNGNLVAYGFVLPAPFVVNLNRTASTIGLFMASSTDEYTGAVRIQRVTLSGTGPTPCGGSTPTPVPSSTVTYTPSPTYTLAPGTPAPPRPTLSGGSCSYGMGCGIVPWRLPALPDLLSPTPIPTIFYISFPTATPTPADSGLSIPDTPGFNENVGNSLEELQTQMAATPSGVENIQGTPVVLEDEVTNLVTNTGLFFGYVRGLTEWNLGKISILVAFAITSFLVVILLKITLFMFPLFTMLFGLIRKLIQLVLDFIPL